MSADWQLERFNKPDVNCVLTARQGQRQLPNLEGPCLLHWRDPSPCATAFGPGKHRKAELGGTGAIEIKKGQLHRDFAMLMSELREGGCVWLRRRKSSAAPFWPPFSALRAELRSGQWIQWSSKRLCSQELANARIPVTGIQRVSDGTGMTEEKERTDLSVTIDWRLIPPSMNCPAARGPSFRSPLQHFYELLEPHSTINPAPTKE